MGGRQERGTQTATDSYGDDQNGTHLRGYKVVPT
jgi:hypothetical protein